MPRQRKSYRNKTAKRRYVSKRRSMRRKRGGGCGCGNGGASGVIPAAANYEKGTPIFNGGSDWSPGLQELPGKNYYPLSSMNADPNYDTVASRQTTNFRVNGGRQARRGKPRGRGKSMRRKSYKGGSSGSAIMGSAISGLSLAVPATVTGASSYSPNFLSDAYTRYTSANPPIA